MNTSRIFRIIRHVGRIICRFRAVSGARGIEWCVVRVLNPATVWIEYADHFTDCVQRSPVGCRVTAIERTVPVEIWVSFGNKVAVPVGNIALTVCIHRVVGRIGAQLHGGGKFFIVAGFGSAIGLCQRLDRLLHQADGYPVAIFLPNDRSVMGVIGSDFNFRHRIPVTKGETDQFFLETPQFVSVLIVVSVILLDDSLEIFIDRIGSAGGVHPSGILVETLIDKKLTPGNRAVCVQPFLAHHMQFRAEEK